MNRLIAAAAGAAMLAAPAAAQDDPIKIGFVTTLTTPAAVIGQDMVDALNLALKHFGDEVAGRKVEVVIEDDGFKPEVGRQKVEKLIQSDDVDIVAGFIWSNVLLASQQPALRAGKLLVSTNAGPSELAGKACNQNFFSTRGQNDVTPMALGEQMNKDGVKSVYIMAPNYAAGKDITRGVESTFKGEVVGKDLTRWGADPQLDFSAELAKVKASGAEAMMVFYPGRAGGAFFSQLERAGLGDMPIYSVWTVDAISMPKMKEAGLEQVKNSVTVEGWSPDLDNAANKRFVEGFKEEYGRYPSFYAMGAYELIPFLYAGIEATGGDISDLKALGDELRKADFESTRGEYAYGKNGYPIADYFAREVVEDADGNWTFKITGTAADDLQDPYVDECDL